MDHLIDIVGGDDAPLEDVEPLLRLPEVKPGAARHYLVAVLDKFADQILQRQHLGRPSTRAMLLQAKEDCRAVIL